MITSNEFFRIEGPAPEYLQIEQRLMEIGQAYNDIPSFVEKIIQFFSKEEKEVNVSWEGLRFKNIVLSLAGWDVNKKYTENPDFAAQIFTKIKAVLDQTEDPEEIVQILHDENGKTIT